MLTPHHEPSRRLPISSDEPSEPSTAAIRGPSSVLSASSMPRRAWALVSCAGRAEGRLSPAQIADAQVHGERIAHRGQP